MTLPPVKKELALVPTPTAEVIPLERSPTIHLKSLHDVRVEMAKVYRSMKNREIEPQDGTRLVYVLSQIGRIVEAQEVSERIDAIERVMKLRGKK